MRSLVVVMLALGCQQNKDKPPPPPPPTPVAIDAGAGMMPIEKVPGFDREPLPGAKHDCRISSVVRRRFAGAKVKPCGTFPLRETRDSALDAKDDAKARTCIEAALVAQQAFVAEKELHGTDSGVARAIVGVLEKGKLVQYYLGFDSNPCGGGCPERGHTTVERCDTFALSDPSCPINSLFDCVVCKPATLVEDCIFGPINPECVIDSKAQDACDAKGPDFSYRPQRSKYCDGIVGEQVDAEARLLLKRPCACLEVAAEARWSERCDKGNEAVH